ncbi:alpha-(1,3)-fucosyltransferase fut-6-like isoform X2 [Littorina saxatilis]|uniref:alpha-(1,3)-fucosyltransferase fut-6-like isoform X2 n=1 Tax=Littorina saxatilis TaxID=31220 RepID=UPI0038B5DAA2
MLAVFAAVGNRLQGILCGALLSYMFWGSLLLIRCGDVEMNPGPGPATSEERVTRQTRLSTSADRHGNATQDFPEKQNMRRCRFPSSVSLFVFIVLSGLTLTFILSRQRYGALLRLDFPDDLIKAPRLMTTASSVSRTTRVAWRMFSNGDWGGASISYVDLERHEDGRKPTNEEQYQTSDDWPQFSKTYFPGAVPRSPFKPKVAIKWGFNTAAFLQRPHVKGHPNKMITWVVPPRNVPPLPEPVRLRVCPEMPCRLTTNATFQSQSAALLWNGQIMRSDPVVRSHPDQVFVFHNNEPQKPDWNHRPSFRKPNWRSNFNWTWTYRNDSDLKAFYGYIVKRRVPLKKNYTEIVARKSKQAVWMCSHCHTHGKREQLVAHLKKHMSVDVYGGCGPFKCPRNKDDSCFEMFNERYKFLFAFENAFCTDYISEKFFRYYESDMIVVARGSNEYERHIPPGTFINTNDFNSTRELAKHLNFLDAHPEEYIKILKKKDEYISLFEDWPIRNHAGQTTYMQYHFEAMGYCEICRRLWELDSYRKTIPDLLEWFDPGNCYLPPDVI